MELENGPAGASQHSARQSRNGGGVRLGWPVTDLLGLDPFGGGGGVQRGRGMVGLGNRGDVDHRRLLHFSHSPLVRKEVGRLS